VEFVNAISADANAHELRETKIEISELRSVIEQLAQKLANTTLVGNNKEAVNVVATTQATQITESKREIEEFKNLLRASNKNYSDMMKQSRDVEKAMKNLQIQVAGTSQPTSQAQPVMQYQQNHSSQFVDKSYQGAQQTPQYYNKNQSKQSNG
jgi:phenylalanyl-tRNA synthetase alpha subunit